MKKYLYVLRPVLAMNWIEKGLGPAPTAIRTLIDRTVTEPELKAAIERLLAAKLAGEELSYGPRIDVIGSFIDREINRPRSVAQYADGSPMAERVDVFFRKTLARIWGLPEMSRRAF